MRIRNYIVSYSPTVFSTVLERPGLWPVGLLCSVLILCVIIPLFVSYLSCYFLQLGTRVNFSLLGLIIKR